MSSNDTRVDEPAPLRVVSWPDLFPWLLVFRCLGLAASLRALLLGAIGLILTLGGWGLLLQLSPDLSGRPGETDWLPIDAFVEIIPDRPPVLDWLVRSESLDPTARIPSASTWTPDGSSWAGDPNMAGRRLATEDPLAAVMSGESDRDSAKGDGRGMLVARSENPLLGTWEHLARPFHVLFFGATKGEHPFLTFTAMFLCALWAVVVWSVFGGAITRHAALRLTGDIHLPIGRSLQFARSRMMSFVSAPLLPLIAVALVAGLIALSGLLLRIPLFEVVVALVWPIPLIGGYLIAILTVGVLFGWPLMWAAIGTENTESFDAIGRAYNYLLMRPLHAIAYVLLAALLGAVGWSFLLNFAAAVVGSTYWAAGLGFGTDRMAEMASAENSLSGSTMAASSLIRFWSNGVKLLAVAYLYSYFWTAATAIYLLLRRDVDATELDEVALDPRDEDPEDLPPLPGDASENDAEEAAGGNGGE